MTDAFGAEVKSEDGEVYTITPFKANLDRLKKLWEVVQKHAPLTSDYTKGDFDFFIDYVMSPGTIMLSVLKNGKDDEEPEEVGVLYADDLIPGVRASAHFIFWDFVLSGRQRLIMKAFKSFMEVFDLHRLEIEIPINAYAALRRLKCMGLLPEGRRRNTLKQEGEWVDTLLFGVCADELTEDAVKRGKLRQIKKSNDWYGLLDREEKLGRFLMRED